MLDRVEVRWLDSMSEAGWHRLDDIKRSIQQDDYMLCTSVGYLLNRGDASLTIVQSQTTGLVADPITIPSAAVLSVKKLRTA